MDKVAAGQLRLISTGVRYGNGWIEAGTPYLVLDGPDPDSSISWLCLLAGKTVSWHEADVRKDKLVVQQ